MLRKTFIGLLAIFIVLAACPAIHAQQTQEIASPLAQDPQVETAGSIAAKVVPVGLRELSPWSMFLSASLVAQSIMVGLAIASLVTWTVFIAKTVELFTLRRRLLAALDAIWDVKSLSQASSVLSKDKSILHSFIAAALSEVRMSSGIDSDNGIKERTQSSFSEITRAESRRVRFGMGVLATIGATSPFVGLFGTVWGIMNSFIGISKLQTTNLAVVAPGIAEALLATAIGLFAAIPAVIIYNHFARATRGYLELVNRAAGAVGRQLSRDLDRSGLKSLRRAAE
jgi:biopolymer transport protein ExbB